MKKLFENIVRKGENEPAFSPIPTMFSNLSRRKLLILATFNLSSANVFNLVYSCLFIKELSWVNSPFPTIRDLKLIHLTLLSASSAFSLGECEIFIWETGLSFLQEKNI